MTLPSSRPLYALLLTALCCTVLGFNVDVKNCIRHQGPEGSMFGFSVAQHKERGRSWLLIGAPEAQTTQPGVVKGGAVYRCGTSREDDCEEIPFDTRGNNNSTRSIQIDSKSRQWFGATVRSSGDNGVILACAPRYVYFTISGNRKDPVGTCYTTRDFNDFSEYSPCRTRNWGHHKQGTCQAGLGASVSKDGSRLFIGAVGSWYWQGQLYSVNSTARLPYLPAIQYIIDDIDEGQFYSQNLYSRPEVLSTNEGPPAEDDSYLGYSVAVGTFGFSSEPGAAVGMPKGGGLLGKVILYSTNLTNLYNITGDQLGAYFGYSICVSDVDGDGGDDIIIGAPLYSEYLKNDGSYETGKVYVYLKKEGYAFYERNTRMGFNSKSRFGLALSGLGDINRDGFGDFAVGAPYDGPHELGAVYIYHGTKTGVRQKYSQLIKSEDVSLGGRPISTFGFSLSGGLDLDNNQYPDLIIGAYESDTAYFMKSRPVAQMTTSVYFKSDNKQIALERRECTTKDGTWVPCLFLTTCLQYTGIGVDDQLNIEMQLVLDAKKPKSPRMFFLLEENRNLLNHSLTLEKNAQSCKTFNVYLKNNIRDKLTSIEAELRYRIIEENRKFTRTLTPVLDLDNELFAVSRDSISIQKNCGGDNICIPNLRLIATPSTESFLLGSNEKLKVDVIVQNEGEDSFETTFDMTVPPGVNYVKIERVDEHEKDIPVQCSAPSIMTNNTLHCDIGNPLPRDTYIQFKVVLEPYQTAETKARYEFNMMVNSTNPENLDSISDNTKYLGVPLRVDTDLIIEGTSKPVDLHYNITAEDVVNITDEKQIGPQVIHIYGIRNKGPSDILEAEAYIDWPLFTLAGDPLLYLLEMPETSGQVKCEAIEEINPLKLNIDRKRKSYFESSGVISNGLGASATIKGESTSSSSNTVVTGTKRFEELTEEEKKRFLEIQKKDEEESKSQWGDGSYEKKVRYQSSKSESSGTTGNERVSGTNGASGSSMTNVNRGPTFTVGSSGGTGGGGMVRNEYESKGTGSSGSSVYTGSSSHDEGSLDSVSKAGSHIVKGGSSGTSTVFESESGSREGNVQYGSSRGVYGAAHFGETDLSSGSSTFHKDSSGGSTLHFGTGSSSQSGSMDGTSNFGTGSDFRGGSSVHRESSGSMEGTSNFGTGSDFRGGSSVHKEFSGSMEGTSNFGAGSDFHGGSSVHTQSSGNMEGNSNFGRGSDSRGGSSVHTQSSGNMEGNSNFGGGSDSRGGSSVYTGSSGNMEGNSNYGRGSDFRGGSSVRKESSVNVNSESHFGSESGGSTVRGSSVYGESSGNFDSSSNSDSDSRGWSSGGSRGSTNNREQSSNKGWGGTSNTDHNDGTHGGRSEVRSQEEKWSHDNRGSAGGNWNANQGGNWNANQGGSWLTTGTGGLQSGKNSTSFHESERRHEVNTTWDGSDGSPKTYVKNQWRTNDDGYVRNGSSTRVEDGVLDYHDAIKKMGNGGVTNVISNIPGDDSDLSVSMSSATERQNQGFRQAKIDESETVQKWRTVDGKLYKVNNVDDWNSLISKDASTEVYEAQDYSPQNYRKPNNINNNNNNNNNKNNPRDQNVDGKFKLYTRFKRDTQMKKCGPTRCATVKCKIGPLSKDEEVWLSFRSRAWVDTLKKVALNRPVTLSSTISAKVTKLPYIGKPDSKLTQVKSHEVFTQAIPRDVVVKPDIIPLWIVVLAAVAGTAILLFLVYLLYKCGFFKRNRPSTAPEKQPLTHRNGQSELYQTGDEAL